MAGNRETETRSLYRVSASASRANRAMCRGRDVSGCREGSSGRAEAREEEATALSGCLATARANFSLIAEKQSRAVRWFGRAAHWHIASSKAETDLQSGRGRVRRGFAGQKSVEAPLSRARSTVRGSDSKMHMIEQQTREMPPKATQRRAPASLDCHHDFSQSGRGAADPIQRHRIAPCEGADTISKAGVPRDWQRPLPPFICHIDAAATRLSTPRGTER
jgi:hypothetical protein